MARRVGKALRLVPAEIVRGRREAEARLLLFVTGAAIPLLVVGFALGNAPFAAAVSPATIGGLSDVTSSSLSGSGAARIV